MGLQTAASPACRCPSPRTVSTSFTPPSPTAPSRPPIAVSASTARPSSRHTRGCPFFASPGHPTLSALLLAAPTADSSHPHRHRPLLSPKPLRRVQRSPPTTSTCFAYPQPISTSDVRHT